MSEDNGHKDDQICCSFCGKSQSEVKKLVAGRGVLYLRRGVLTYASVLSMTEMNELDKGKRRCQNFRQYNGETAHTFKNQRVS